jgi:LysR family glycine cleavage system transcriptional activator
MAASSTRRRFPSLNALRAFEAAARHQSYKDAAEELCVSQSAISHQIKGLEEALGTALFLRRTRGVELTRKGRLFYPILRNAFDAIAEGTALVTEQGTASVLTLHVYSTFTIRWLLPRLARFQAANPLVDIRLHTAQSDPGFEQEDIDASIMITQPRHAALHYDHLFDCEMFPVCSPQYLAKRGPIARPTDLAGHPLLQVYPSLQDWSMWLEAKGVRNVYPDAGLQFESYDVALAGAAQGIGIALGQQPYMERDFATGALVELFPGARVRNPNSWYLVCRSEKRDLAKIDALRQWLVEEVNADASLAPGADLRPAAPATVP